MGSDDAKKLLMAVSLLLAISVAFFFLFWRPGFTKLKKYQVSVSKKTSQLRQLEQDIKDWPESFSQETMRKYEGELEQLWSLIPSEEEVAGLLEDIQTRAKSARLEILSLSRVSTGTATFESGQPKVDTGIPSAQEKLQGKIQYVRVPYKITLGGGYFGLVTFMRELEDSRRLVTVNSIDMYIGKGHPVNAEIQFSIFYSRGSS